MWGVWVVSSRMVGVRCEQQDSECGMWGVWGVVCVRCGVCEV